MRRQSRAALRTVGQFFCLQRIMSASASRPSVRLLPLGNGHFATLGTVTSELPQPASPGGTGGQKPRTVRTFWAVCQRELALSAVPFPPGAASLLARTAARGSRIQTGCDLRGQRAGEPAQGPYD